MYEMNIHYVCFFGSILSASFACNICAVDNKPSSFMDTAIKPQGFKRPAGSYSTPTLNVGYTNWFPLLVQKEGINKNDPYTNPSNNNIWYSFNVNTVLGSTLSRYILNRDSEVAELVKSKLAQPVWPFYKPLTILNKLPESESRNQIEVKIKTNQIFKQFSNFQIHNYLPLNFVSLYFRSFQPNLQSLLRNVNFIEGDNNRPISSSTGIFSRSVNKNLGKFSINNLLKKLNSITMRTSRMPIFKHFVRPERNPCYSEHINSSGIYYKYDVLKVFRYLHGYSGWGDHATEAKKGNNDFILRMYSTNDNNSKEPDNSLRTSKENKNVNGFPNSSNFFRKDKDSTIKEEGLQHILNSKRRTPYKFQSSSKSEESNSLVESQNIGVDANRQRQTSYSQIYPKSTETTLRKLKQINEGARYGNIYADPDGVYKRPTQNKFYVSSIRYVAPRQRAILDEMARIEGDIQKKMSLIKKYTNLCYFKRNLAISKTVLKTGNTYADPNDKY